MRRIEFLGANGVGKTTLLQASIGLLENRCLDQTQARAKLVTRQLSEESVTRRLVERIKWRNTARRSRRIRSYRNRAIQQALSIPDCGLTDFCDLVLRVVASSSLTVMQKQEMVTWFYDALYDATYLDGSDSTLGALCDESVGLKTLMIAMLTESDAQADRLFALMPLPFAVVKVTGSDATIYQRLAQRQANKPFTPLPYLAGLDEQATMAQLKRMNALAEKDCRVLAARGCPIITIDISRGTFESQVDRFKTKLEKYLHSKEANYA